MEQRFYNEDFEKLIKEKADQFKMYPSAKVWTAVYRSLHNTGKWYWMGFLLFLAGVAYLGFDLSGTGNGRKNLAVQTKPSGSALKTEKPATARVVPFLTSSPEPVSGQKSNASRKEPGKLVSLSDNSLIPPNPDNITQGESGEPSDHSTNPVPVAFNENKTVYVPNPVDAGFKPSVWLNTSGMKPLLKNEIAEPSAPKLKPANQESLKDAAKINWLQEYAAYEFQTPKLKRLSWMVSFAPTMNYRKMRGNDQASVPSNLINVPLSLDIKADINHLVNHKPAIGFELGTFGLYSVNRRLNFKAGVQFNYSQYDIQAYGSSKNEIATIALNNSYFNPDALTTVTRLRNFSGNEIKSLRNQYFQLSAPVGAEWMLFGGRRLQLSVAGSLQPTILLNRDSYLITTDFINYTREPSLLRRWNVNSSIETFVSYRAGGLKWQLGPQFRYQLLSTYTNKYPFREFLMEYGVKLSISKNFR